MPRPSLSGRADLLALLATTEPARKTELAALLGYEPRAPRPVPRAKPQPTLDLPEQPFTPPTDAPKVEPEAERQAPSSGEHVVFWQCVERRPLATGVGEEAGPVWWQQARLIRDRQDEDRSNWRLPSLPPLLQWPRMLGFLRHHATRWQPTRRLDEPRLVEDLTHGQPPVRIPWRAQRRWPDTLILLQDRHLDLYPLRHDYGHLSRRLEALLGARIKVLVTDENTDPGAPLTDLLARAGITPEAAASAYWLILSDLGVLECGYARVELWHRLTRELGQMGLPQAPFVLLPLEAAQVLADEVMGPHVGDLTLVPWDLGRPLHPVGTGIRPAPPASVDELVALLSMAVEAHPRLLRALRLALDHAGLGGGVAWELEAWNHPDVLRALPECFLHPHRRRVYQECFEDLPSEIQDQALALIADHNVQARAHVRDVEQAWAVAHRGGDAADQDFLADAAYSLCRAHGAERELLVHWADLLLDGTRTDIRRRNPKLGALEILLVSEGEQEIKPDQTLLALVEFAFLFVDEPIKDYTVVQRGNDLGLLPAAVAEQLTPAHRLTRLRSRSTVIDVELAVDGEGETFWEGGKSPPWARNWGTDAHGAWVDFEAGGVLQRLRWIQPGEFLMGSGDGDVAAYDDERPKHPVTFAEGFWLAETTCTQALWEAVMGENPSSFRGDAIPDHREHPVEQVSWNQVQEFIQRLNTQVPGLGVRLPSEAEWEYACRAGTESAYFFGDEIGPEQAHFGQDLDKGATVPVKRFAPNAWGLYQMHGNVLEWCADCWHENYRGAPGDGAPWLEGDDGKCDQRLVRGGSWDGSARRLRSASRNHWHRVARRDFLGFRLSRGPEFKPSERAGDARRAPGREARDRAAEPRAEPPSPGAAAALLLPQAFRIVLPRAAIDLDKPVADAVPLPPAPELLLRSDREQIRLRTLRRPGWATAMGRDGYGLFAAFSVGDVTQRLRWIEPGGFLMGSPEGEPDRSDSEGPQHPVIFTEGFWLAETACTQALWEAVMGENPSRFQGDAYPDHRDLPVEQVSWDEVQAFIQRLNTQVPGFGGRLPSEAEWEYACRAGTERAYFFGNEIGPEQAHFSQDLDKGATVPVKSFAPNAWGLYQMHGNVWEWCADCWHENYQGAPNDGRSWLEADGGECDQRLIRGGSWGVTAGGLRSAYRRLGPRGDRIDALGCRLSRGPELEPDRAEPSRAATSGAGAARDGDRKIRGKAKQLFERLGRFLGPKDLES